MKKGVLCPFAPLKKGVLCPFADPRHAARASLLAPCAMGDNCKPTSAETMLQLLGIWLVNGCLANKGERSALRASMFHTAQIRARNKAHDKNNFAS